MLERIVLTRQLTALHLRDLRANAEHRLAEAVQLRLVFAFRRLDHQRAGDREADGRRMEAVVHQALGDVLHLDARAALEWTRIHDAFVCDGAVRATIEHRVGMLQPLRDVVRVQDRDLRGIRQSLGAHHADVQVADRQDAGAAERCGADRTRALRRAESRGCVSREMRHEVRGDTDRAHARTAATVRNAERLVQVQVADVGADVTGAADTDHRVHVRAVHVHLTAVRMDRGADVGDVGFEHAVRARIRDHQRCQIGRVFDGLRGQVGDVDVAIGGGLHRHDLHAAHRGAGRVGAVRAGRYQADGAMPFAASLMVAPDGQQTGILTLRAGVGLQRDGRETGDVGECRFQLLEQLRVALRLLAWCERMQLAEFGPRHRIHLGGRVELHGATAERNHRVHERQVLRLELLDVAQHRRLAVVRVEHRMRHERRRACEALVVAWRALGGQRVHIQSARFAAIEDREQRGDVRQRRRLVQRDTDRSLAEPAQVDAICRCGSHDVLHAMHADFHAHGVEHIVMEHLQAKLLESRHEGGGEALDAARDACQASGSVIDAVHAGHHRQQHLRRADVAGGLLAADVLLTGLQRHAQRRLAMTVAADADDAPRQQTLEFVARGEECGVRPAIAHRHAESLRTADGDVGAPLTGRRKQRQRHQVGCGGDQRTHRVCSLAERRIVHDRAVGRRILDQRSEELARQLGRRGIAGDDRPAS